MDDQVSMTLQGQMELAMHNIRNHGAELALVDSMSVDGTTQAWIIVAMHEDGDNAIMVPLGIAVDDCSRKYQPMLAQGNA